MFVISLLIGKQNKNTKHITMCTFSGYRSVEENLSTLKFGSFIRTANSLKQNSPTKPK